MATRQSRQAQFEAHWLDPLRWVDFEQLFGPKGACGGCWCMLWRSTRKEFEQQKGEGNKRAMHGLVHSGQPTGIIGYLNGKPMAWCSVAPRESFPALNRSRILKKVDDQPVWSITCFFVEKHHRGQGLSVQLLKSAIGCVDDRGGRILEGYPVEPRTQTIAAVFAWTGLARAFRQAGFIECARRSVTRPIMRYTIVKADR